MSEFSLADLAGVPTSFETDLRAILGRSSNLLPELLHTTERRLSREVVFERGEVDELFVKALQRAFVYLSYPTSMSGSALVDGDAGPGTNRALAFFLMEEGLPHENDPGALASSTIADVKRKMASERLTREGLASLLRAVFYRATGAPTGGSMIASIDHLNATESGIQLSCRKMFDLYGGDAARAARELKAGAAAVADPAFLLAVAKQETHGIIRSRFEQHYYAARRPMVEEGKGRLARLQASSHGLGQIMGSNAKALGLGDVYQLWSAAPQEQLEYIGRFILTTPAAVVLSGKSPIDLKGCRLVARYYNGPAFAANRYDQRLLGWYTEFRALFAGG